MRGNYMNELKQKKIFIFGTFLTGGTALIYQIVWQKYLSLLIGVEGRSQALIIAFFLTGLAIGYYFFGNFQYHLTKNHPLIYHIMIYIHHLFEN